MKSFEPGSRTFAGALIVAALGYFVDVYDLILFSVVRLTSLRSLGLAEEQLTSEGLFLLNVQMVGMFLGGIVWGLLGDRFGRKRALFGSILLYSIANVCNAFVESVTTYAVCRCIAGIGLAGELGAGITLVAELMPKHLRGYGTTVVASIGVLGAVVAGLTGELLPWRMTYVVGGALGLALLFIRISVSESSLFEHGATRALRAGLCALLFSPSRVFRYLCCILVGVPIWYVIGLLVTLAPEFGRALSAPELPSVAYAVTFCYAGLFLGDIASGLVSQWLKSRKRALAFFLLLTILSSFLFLSMSAPSLTTLYSMYVILGFSAGFWVLVVTTAAEQFGTNIRATVTTTVPNLIRGAVLPISTTYSALQSGVGVVTAAMLVSVGVSVLASLSLFALKETFHNDLDFQE